jgi:predicted metal-dependent hydrolase
MVDPSPLVEVRRSARRRRTVSAYRDGDKIVVLMPARITRSEEQRLVAEMVDRVTRREASYATSGARSSDGALLRRASELSGSHLDGRARPVSVRWVSNMNSRWGSCTTTDRTIRLSHRLQAMPSWVIDYVLMHELAHLLEAGHGPGFWQWVNRYPRTERARGYLEGVAMATQLPGVSSGEPSEGVGGGASVGGAASGPAGSGWICDSWLDESESDEPDEPWLPPLAEAGPLGGCSAPPRGRSKSARSGTDSSGALP